MAARTVCLFNKMKWRKIPIKFHIPTDINTIGKKCLVSGLHFRCAYIVSELQQTNATKNKLLWAIKDIISIWLHNSSLFALIPHRFASCYVKLFRIKVFVIYCRIKVEKCFLHTSNIWRCWGFCWQQIKPIPWTSFNQSSSGSFFSVVLRKS